jgi:hypothetical protein
LLSVIRRKINIAAIIAAPFIIAVGYDKGTIAVSLAAAFVEIAPCQNKSNYHSGDDNPQRSVELLHKNSFGVLIFIRPGFSP